MGGNSFCMLFVGLTIVAIIGIVAAFATAWSLVESEYALEPADNWILVGGLTATSATFKIKYPENLDATLLTLVVSTSSEIIADDGNANAEPIVGVDSNSNNPATSQNNNGGSGGAIEPTAIAKVQRIELGGATTTTTIFDNTQQQNGTTAAANNPGTTTTTGKPSLERRHGIETIVVQNLSPQQRYYYYMEEQLIKSSGQIDIDRDKWAGSFATPAPAGTRFNFTIATAGCAWTGSKSPIFQQAQKEEPLLFLHLGDFHYEDIGVNDMQKRIDAISTVLASPQQAQLYRSTAFVGIWDDHDWLGNDSDGVENDVGARKTALLSYQMAFPHYPLAALVGNPAYSVNATTTTTTAFSSTTATTGMEVPVPIYQAFTIGTVRFLLSDLRSEATETVMYSEEQKDWLMDELRKASNYDYVVWVSSKPWIGAIKEGDDAWPGYSSERRELSEFISTTLGADDGPQNLLVVSSDAHMVAFDDGTNTYYGPTTTTGNATHNGTFVTSFPILQSGSLDRLGSAKGDHFTDGCYAFELERTHQFSTIKFEFGDNDGDENNCIQIDSYRAIDFFGQSRETLLSKRLCGKLFVPAAITQEDKVGHCKIDQLWEVNENISIAVSVIAGISIVLSWIALRSSESSNIGDCCCKSFLTTIFICISLVITTAVGLGVFVGRGIQQYTLMPIASVSLAESVLFLFYIFIWWSCCTSPNRPRRDDDDPAFTDVEPNPHINGVDLFYTTEDEGGMVPGNSGMSSSGAQPY